VNLEDHVWAGTVPESDLAALLAAGVTTEHDRFSRDQLAEIKDFMKFYGCNCPPPNIVTDWSEYGIPSPMLQWKRGQRVLDLRFEPNGSVTFSKYEGAQAGRLLEREELWCSFDLERLVKWVME
jgi:hypothetical protein